MGLEQSVKGKIKKHSETEFGWPGFSWWEISSPLDGSSQSYVHINSVHQDGKTLP